MENAVLLEIKGLYKDFSGIKIIEGIDLSVKRGERHAIIGPNGAGKTTFFNLLTGRYKPSKGHIYFNGREITGWPPHKINRMGISRSFQITNIFPGLTVFENVRAAVLSKNHIRFNLISQVDGMKNITEETYFKK
jgi:branched-chain amino acid transport system ATP-binding protein